MKEENTIGFVQVAQLDELTVNDGLPIKVNNICIALFKLESGKVFAVENSCPHIGAPLHNGIIEDENITCLWHGWCFDMKNGKSTNCPGVQIKSFPVKIISQEIWLKLPVSESSDESIEKPSETI